MQNVFLGGREAVRNDNKNCGFPLKTFQHMIFIASFHHISLWDLIELSGTISVGGPPAPTSRFWPLGLYDIVLRAFCTQAV